MTPPHFPGRDDPAAPASLAGQPRVLVVGAGAIGGVVAAKLARAGHAVTALDADGEHVARLTADLERGSPTEVDVINGAVVAQSAALGRTAPLNQRVVELVHECERGARRPGRDTLAALRAALGPAAPVRHLSPEPGARHG